MDFISNTKEDIKTMLEVIGIKSVDDLFSGVPQKLLESKPEIPKGMSEPETISLLQGLAKKNSTVKDYHYISSPTGLL